MLWLAGWLWIQGEGVFCWCVGPNKICARSPSSGPVQNLKIKLTCFLTDGITLLSRKIQIQYKCKCPWIKKQSNKLTNYHWSSKSMKYQLIILLLFSFPGNRISVFPRNWLLARSLVTYFWLEIIQLTIFRLYVFSMGGSSLWNLNTHTLLAR